MTDSQSTENHRGWSVFWLVFGVTVIILTIAALAASRAYAGTAGGRTCWQMKFTFVGFPSYPSTFARWRLTQGKRTFASGEFVFRADAGGFYQRRISSCVTGINEKRRVRVSVRTIDRACPTHCYILAALRKRP